MIRRFRVWLASLLIRRTLVVLVRARLVTDLRAAALTLHQYVESSGGLQEPHRIKAYRRILRLANEIELLSRAVLVGEQTLEEPPVSAPAWTYSRFTVTTQPNEENHAPEATTEAATG